MDETNFEMDDIDLEYIAAHATGRAALLAKFVLGDNIFESEDSVSQALYQD